MVPVPAKRWKGTVSRPTIQSFVGSMDMIRAKKGVVITTLDYSRDPIDFVDRIEGKRVMLINKKQLAQLMIEHDIGVSAIGTYCLKEVSNDFFEEELGCSRIILSSSNLRPKNRGFPIRKRNLRKCQLCC
jgi:restriction system protein